MNGGITLNPTFPHLRRKHRAGPVPPESRRLMANIDAGLEQNIVHLSLRQRAAGEHHRVLTNDLGRRIEIAEGSFHPLTLRTTLIGLDPGCFDRAFH